MSNINESNKNIKGLLGVKKVYYHDIGERIIITFRTRLIDPVSVDSDWYLDKETALKLKCELDKLLK